MRRAILFASLVLAVGIVTPATGLGKAGGTNLPLKGKASGISTLNTGTGAFLITATGKASHLGRYSETNQGFIFPGCTQLCIVGSYTKTAASGAELSGDFTGTGTTADGVHFTFLLNGTITEGTDRFEDASGSLTATVFLTRISIANGIATSELVGPWTGKLNLNKKKP